MTPMSAAPESGFLTTGQVATRLGATTQYVRELIRSGALDAIDIGIGARARFRVAEASVTKFLNERVVRSTTAEVA